MHTHSLTWRSHRLDLGERTAIMGILNVTPDSFSDGGHYLDPDQAVSRAEKMAADGADIIDVGGESTRPYADAVDVREEMRRIIPVIKGIVRRIPLPVSVDTRKSVVAEAALDAGAAMLNDISALRHDRGMARLAARYAVPVVIMHMQGTPKDMQVAPVYRDLIGEITSFLKTGIETAVRVGVQPSRIIIDPGIGFGKTLGHNLGILKHLQRFAVLDCPILVGTSRKAFLRQLLKPSTRPGLDPLAPIVQTGTQASVAAAALNGAHMVRVHDVAGARAALTIADAIRNAEC